MRFSFVALRITVTSRGCALQKGSALVFSMLLLAMLMASGLAIVASSLADHRASLATSRSALAIQNAESGIEDVLKIFKGKVAKDTLDDAFVSDCHGGVYSKTDYTVYFYDGTDPDDTCNDSDKIDACSAEIQTVKSTRSVGVHAGVSRAVCVPLK